MTFSSFKQNTTLIDEHTSTCKKKKKTVRRHDNRFKLFSTPYSRIHQKLGNFRQANPRQFSHNVKLLVLSLVFGQLVKI